jgi:hypothetical protein
MKMKILSGLTSICLLTGGMVHASPLVALPGATFGGTGIPATDVEVTTIANGGDAITLGLTATPKYPNQPIGSSLPNDNNTATFFATPGVGVTPGRATWNFDYYIGVANGDFANYTFELVYGNNPASLASFDPVAVANHDGGKSVTSTTREDSENLAFSLGTLTGFDLNAVGQYTFQLEAFGLNQAGAPTLLGESDITVDVGTVPDTASSALLICLGVGSLLVFGLRQNRRTVAK